MKQKIMEEIMQQMLPHLDNAQLQKLEEVLEHSLFMYEISSKYTETEDDSQKLIDAFVYAKRIEGCSEKTLKYYRTTIETMTEAIDKGVRHMQTDDLRAYLTEYQEKHGSSRVTIDNIRRILSSFLPIQQARLKKIWLKSSFEWLRMRWIATLTGVISCGTSV